MIRHHAPPQQLHGAEKCRAHHHFDKALLLLRVKEEGAMRHPRDEMVATIRQDNPVLRRVAESITNDAAQSTSYTLDPIHSGLTFLC